MLAVSPIEINVNMKFKTGIFSKLDLWFRSSGNLGKSPCTRTIKKSGDLGRNNLQCFQLPLQLL